MRVASMLTALVAISSASALTLKIMAETIKSYKWSVTGWTAGCEPTGCYYDFNISGAANLTAKPARPAFSAHCVGSGEGARYAFCERLDTEDIDARVAAKLLPTNATGSLLKMANIQVSLRHTDLDVSTTWWNYTGHAAARYNGPSAPTQNFTIRPSEITGAA